MISYPLPHNIGLMIEVSKDHFCLSVEIILKQEQ
jgi:hypothetical protein